MIRLGVIGLGTRATHIATLLCQEDREVRVALVADPHIDAARQRLLDAKIDASQTQFIDDDDLLFERADDVDALIVGTRCNLHASLAARWAKTKKPLFLEKPVGLNVPELQALIDAWAGRESIVVVSFPLRVTPLIQRVVQIAKSGRLGTINQVQAFNYVPYGGVYFGQWYREFETTGGLWLQKATHDFDYINHLIQSTPTQIAAMGSRRIYGGDMPPEQRCNNCSRADVCPEGPIAIRDRGDDGGMGYGDHACAFSTSIRHHDASQRANPLRERRPCVVRTQLRDPPVGRLARRTHYRISRHTRVRLVRRNHSRHRPPGDECGRDKSHSSAGPSWRRFVSDPQLPRRD